METYKFEDKEIVFVVSSDGCVKCILADKTGKECLCSVDYLREHGIPDCVFDRPMGEEGYYEEKK